MFCTIADDTLPDLNDLAGLTQVTKDKGSITSSSSSSDIIIVDEDSNDKPLYSDILKGATIKVETNQRCLFYTTT